MFKLMISLGSIYVLRWAMVSDDEGKGQREPEMHRLDCSDAQKPLLNNLNISFLDLNNKGAATPMKKK
jgi:hypothetical protein